MTKIWLGDRLLDTRPVIKRGGDNSGQWWHVVLWILLSCVFIAFSYYAGFENGMAIGQQENLYEILHGR